MKRLFYISLSVLLAGAFFSSCEKPAPVPEEKSNDCSIKGIIAYSPSATRGSDDLVASVDKSTNMITLTTEPVYTNEVPVDLTKVSVELTLAKGATSDVKDSYDLDGKTAKLVITAEDGETTAEWTISAVRSDPMVVLPTSITAQFSQVWCKTTAEMNLKSPLWGSRGMTAFRDGGKDYLYILDNVLPYSDDNKIRIYDAKTGAYVSQIEEYNNGEMKPGCRSYMWDVDVDEDGHIATTRLNADQAGFFLDLYDNAAGGWEYLGTPLGYIQDTPGLTYYCGKKVQVLGNLVQGQGTVIATWGHFYGNYIIAAGYDVFPFINGVSENIMAQAYPTEWWAGEVQQESMTNQTKYVTINFENGYQPGLSDEEGAEFTGAHVEIYDPAAGTVIEIPEECFTYRILGTKVFNCGSGKYLYTLGQGFNIEGPYIERLYYISDTEMLKTISPESPDWNKFMLWEHKDEAGGDSGEHRFGSVAVLPDAAGTSAVLFSYHASSDGELAKVNATRVTITETFD